jgi:hypothetical protein
MNSRLYVVLAACAFTAPVTAQVLDDDRMDVMYHVYEGGGETIDGPSILVRKKFADKYAVSAGYYADMVSSASIDVITTASPYREQRREYGLGFEYRSDGTLYKLGLSHGKESDYESNAAQAIVRQSLFGDLTNVSLSYARGWDKVFRNGDASFSDHVDRNVFGIDVSQIATERLVVGLAWEAVTEDGYLNNPYRLVRYLDPGAPRGYSYEPERYPRTRSGSALAVRASYRLPFRAAVQGEYRYYSDDWKVRAHTIEASYTVPFGDRWIFDAHMRYYTQDGASFYSDLYPGQDFQEFLARDKTLSSMSSQTVGVGASYQFIMPWVNFFQKSTVNLKYDLITYQFDDFRDLRWSEYAPGTEPLYSYDASVIQVYFSGWF